MELLKRAFIVTLFFYGCTRPAPHPPKVSQPPSAYGDSLVVDSPEVVFFQQDSLRLGEIKAILKDRLFQSLSHDCLFEMKYARSVVQRFRPSLMVMNTSANRWLIFKKKTGARIAIDLNAINDLCGVFLFDGIKDPIRANMPNIASQLWFYFGEGRY